VNRESVAPRSGPSFRLGSRRDSEQDKERG
jgi:hypothetical protein